VTVFEEWNNSDKKIELVPFGFLELFMQFHDTISQRTPFDVIASCGKTRECKIKKWSSVSVYVGSFVSGVCGYPDVQPCELFMDSFEVSQKVSLFYP